MAKKKHLPIWPGFKSRRRRHTWVELVFGSLLCSERFISEYSSFLSPQNPTFSNPKSTRNGRRRTNLNISAYQIFNIINVFY